MSSGHPAPVATGERAGLWALGVFSAVAVIGYAVFALHPENLTRVPWGPQFFGISFRLFAQMHVLLAFAALAYVLTRRTGWRWFPALGAVGALSLIAEHVGTGYGVPFGGYGYTELLGWRIGPRVPVLIPVSWFLMALPGWVVARAAFPEARAARLILGAGSLVLWDLALDPAMSFLTPYWRWHESGAYYGMPWLNLVGWFATGLALMAALEALGSGGRFDPLPAGWMLSFWATVLILPLGMLAAAGAWPAVATTLSAVAVTAGVVHAVRARVAGVETPPAVHARTPSPPVGS